MKTAIYAVAAAVASLFVAVPATAAEIAGKARTYTHSCGYFSSVVADVIIDYHNETLPWGVIVEMIYGFEGDHHLGGGRSERFEWQWEDRLILDATSGYTWTAEVEVPVAYRSRADFFDGLNFVFRIIYPDGRVEFDNGGDSPWGFYTLPVDDRGPCTSVGMQLPSFEDKAIVVTERY